MSRSIPLPRYVNKLRALVIYVFITINISVSREVGNTTDNWWQITAP